MHKKLVPVASNKRSCLAVQQERERQFYCIWIQEFKESVDILLIQQINQYHEDLLSPGHQVILKSEHPLTGISVAGCLGNRTGGWGQVGPEPSFWLTTLPRVRWQGLLPTKVEIMRVTQWRALRWADWWGSHVLWPASSCTPFLLEGQEPPSRRLLSTTPSRDPMRGHPRGWGSGWSTGCTKRQSHRGCTRSSPSSPIFQGWKFRTSPMSVW